jgi:hypothetical protein
MVNTPEMWAGDWTLYNSSAPYTNTLRIRETKADCAGPPWCSLAISLKRDTDGKTWSGRIEKMDDLFRHMVFYIGPTKNDVQIFVYRNKMAGQRYGPRPSYFYAIKK